MNKDKHEQLVNEYNTGQFSIAMLSKTHKVSVGKIYQILHEGGCVFTRKRRAPVTPEERENRSRAYKGRVISEKQRHMISERNSCNYNGLNGYGHIKKHNCGYVLAYAPLHPNAHKDGYVMLHTIIIERSIGRYLNKDEVVHHINHDRTDNRIENLLLMKKKEHMSMHMKERHMKKRGNDLLTV